MTTTAASDLVGRFPQVAGIYVQAITATVSVDTTIPGGAPFVDLLSFAMTTAGGDVELFVTWAARRTDSNAVRSQGDFRITVDGTPNKGSGDVFFGAPNRPRSGAVSDRVSLAAGPHTIALQWRDNGMTNVLAVLPVTEPGSLHATLTARELTP